MRPEEGQRDEVEGLLDALDEFLSTQQGYVMGFRFHGVSDRDHIGRISVWMSQDDANRAARLTHTETLRSNIHRRIEAGHIEELAEIVGNPRNLPVPPEA